MTRVEEGDTSPLNLHKYISILASKSDLIEEELLDHQLAASNKDQQNSAASDRNLHIRTAAVSFITLIENCSILVLLRSKIYIVPLDLATAEKDWLYCKSMVDFKGSS